MAELPEDHNRDLNRFRFKNYSSPKTPAVLKNLPRAAVIVVVIVVLLLIGRQVHHHYVNKPTKPNTAASAPHAPAASQTAQNNKKTAGSATTNSTNRTIGGRGSTQLANTGPGNVLAVFLGAVVLGASAHFLVTSNRQLQK